MPSIGTPLIIPGVDYRARKPSLMLFGTRYTRGEVIPADELTSYRLQQLLQSGFIEQVPPDPKAKPMPTPVSATLSASADMKSALRKKRV